MALLTKVKTTLALQTRRKATGLLDGQYASLLAGRSLDFADLREYVPGDDVKDIDWKATARAHQPLVKRYVADRKHTLVLAVAAGRDMAGHATVTEAKRDVVITVAGLLGYLATRHGDYVGLELSNGEAVQAVRPSSKEIELERMLQLVQARSRADQPPADVEALLSFTVGALRRRMIVAVVMDDVALPPAAESLLRRLLVQHDVLLVTIGDVAPAAVAVAHREAVTVGDRHALPHFLAADARLVRDIDEQRATRHRERDELLTRLGVPHAHVTSSDEALSAVFRLLERTRRAHR